MLKMKKKFWILAHARSGSSNLRHAFNSQGMDLLGEPFNPSVTMDNINEATQVGYMKVFKKLFRQHDGMKHLDVQAPREINVEVASKFRTILIYRENLFNAALSSAMAWETGVWQRKPDVIGKYHEVTELNVEKVMKHFNRFRTNVQYNKENCPNAFHVVYENLYQPDEDKRIEIAKEIFDFAKVKIVDLDLVKKWLDRSKKLNRKPWSETLTNYDDLVKARNRALKADSAE